MVLANDVDNTVVGEWEWWRIFKQNGRLKKAYKWNQKEKAINSRAQKAESEFGKCHT